MLRMRSRCRYSILIAPSRSCSRRRSAARPRTTERSFIAPRTAKRTFSRSSLHTRATRPSTTLTISSASLVSSMVLMAVLMFPPSTAYIDDGRGRRFPGRMLHARDVHAPGPRRRREERRDPPRRGPPRRRPPRQLLPRRPRLLALQGTRRRRRGEPHPPDERGEALRQPARLRRGT